MSNMAGEQFKRFVSMLPVSTDSLLASAITFFISEQNPSEVKMKVHVDDDDNVVGYSIRVKTSKEETYDAKQFWENYVEPKLGDKQ